MSPTLVSVKLADRGYQVRFGSLNRLGRILKEAGFPRDVFVMADRRVWSLLPAKARKAVLGLGRTGLKLLPPGEASKSVSRWLECSETLAVFDSKMRTPGVLALGGGVTGDLAGFVAATYRRGVPLYMVPSTLLSMVDSSVGGKVAVDLGGIKNRVGAFHQPSGVLIDVSFLKSLPDREYRSGLAEVVKYGAVLDRAFFESLDGLVPDLLRRDPRTLASVIRRCAQIKAGVVAKDERDSSGHRALLNFGHTVGHAVESALMPRLLHGEAVAFGMACEAELALSLGMMKASEAQRLILLLERLGLRTRIKAPLAKVLKAIKGDKKFESGRMRFALAGPLGRGRLTDRVKAAALLRVLKARLGA